MGSTLGGHTSDVTIDATFTLTLSLEDTAILSEMQLAGRHASIDHVLAQAVYLYARHLEIGPVPVTFMAGTLRRKR